MKYLLDNFVQNKYKVAHIVCQPSESVLDSIELLNLILPCFRISKHHVAMYKNWSS